MRTLPTLATALLAACLAGCGNNAPPPAPAPDKPAAGAPADAAASARDDEGVLRRFDCQAGTTVAVLANGDARVSLPGGQQHFLSPVAGSEPQVYTGDTLYFTVEAASADADTADAASTGAATAHLSQQDGARELACGETS
ncbi:hypothetical protein [Luteimonas lutimaris]|uniref:C-type lysozyme inhibitor domain-containing protein n=1 Tax=Luteimonas lutimaris TaxID=698645 RepID=A0ABP7MZD5_9GAMM|nr:hypothetical protein [Luteimonas sp.]